MSGMLNIDVLVVGLGPAGGAAASAAARSGANVLAVERKPDIGTPVQCAEFIPLPLSAHAQAEGVLAQRIAAMHTTLPSGEVERSAFPGLMIDRAAFDRALAKEAERHGARLWLGSRLARLNTAASQAVIETPEGTHPVRYRTLIAADGPHSSVAKALGLPPLETIHTRQYTVSLRQPCEHIDIWLSGNFSGGYAWLFPKGQMANLGLGADKQFAENLKTPLDRLHCQLAGEERVGKRIHARTGGAIPVSGPRALLAVGNVLFVGDAAGLTHPITGAGIAAAVISGESAGKAAATWLGGRQTALEEFEQDIRDQFEASLMRAVAKRRWLRTVWGTALSERETQRRGWTAFPEYFAA